MGQYLRINGDYNIQTRNSASQAGIITLDTGPAAYGGQVLITGDLVVEGETLTVNAEDLNIKDNIITLNTGESSTHDGVTLTYSGIEIERGAASNALFLYDDSGAGKGTFVLAHGTTGALDYEDAALRLHEIKTDSDTDDGNLILIGTGTGVVNVAGTTNYKAQVIAFGDDAIPNKKYVDDAIRDNPTFQIITDPPPDPLNPVPNTATRVIVTDRDVTDLGDGVSSVQYYENNTDYTFPADEQAAVSVLVNGTQIAQFFTNRLEVGDLELGGGDTRTEITTKEGITNENIFIRTQGTGKLETNYALQLDRFTGSMDLKLPPVSGSTVVYALTPSIGKSGVFFSNDTDSSDEYNYSGELVSKNRALLFSMIF